MNPATYGYQILLGKINRTSGYNGVVSVKLEQFFIDNLPSMESVFLEIDGKPVPFFISGIEYPGGDILKFKFEGYNTLEKVCEFIGCRVYLTDTGATPDIHLQNQSDITGFRVISSIGKLIGTTERITRNPGQDLLVILSPGGKEILIPFHEDLILGIDNKKKTIKVELPEGLTEIN